MNVLLRHSPRAIVLLVALLISPGVAHAQAATQGTTAAEITFSAGCPAEVGHIPREAVTGRVTAQNGFAWNYGCDMEFKDGVLLVGVAINLIPAGGVTHPELDRVKPAWEKGIEEVWRNKFSIATPAGERYPIMIDVSFKGPRYHHEVVVRPGTGCSDELNWNLLDSPQLVAHEFGHMLGVFDEYKGGGTAPHGAAIDTTSIMTRNPAGHATTHARHYKRFRAWFVDKTRLRNVSLVPN